MRQSADFARAVRQGRRAGRPTLVVHAWAPSDEAAPADEVRDAPRVGLVVSRAVGSAVTRNGVKRRLRALARSRIDALPTGTLLVIRANPASAGASSSELGGDLDRALGRLGAGHAPSGRRS